ncbi:026R [Invertebrate iridescent virus Kaz2018]|nr:026R [Invertebrate iridescent virus Kaz2018]
MAISFFSDTSYIIKSILLISLFSIIPLEDEVTALKSSSLRETSELNKEEGITTCLYTFN